MFAETGGNHKGGRHRRNVGIEQIRPHSGHVAHVITDIIGDNRGIARVVFGNAEFNLAAEVGAYIGGFGKNAAARLCKQGKRACAKAESEKGGHVVCNQVNKCYTEQAGAHNRHSHDRAAAEP